MQTWRDLARELGLALRVAATRPAPALLALLTASILVGAGDAQANTALRRLADFAGSLGMMFAMAALMRAYAPALQRPVTEPRRGPFYLIWAAVCVCWPVLLYGVVEQAVLHLFPVMPRQAAVTIAWAFLLPFGVFIMLAAWAFAEVVVSATAAPDAIARILRAARSPAVLLRAVAVPVLFAVTTGVLWAGLQRLLGPLATTEPLRTAAFAVESVGDYAALCAILIATLPPVAQPVRKRAVKPATA